MTSRIGALTRFLLIDFVRSLRVVVPPGLLLALYRVFFLYGSDARYFGAIGALMLGSICIVTALLIASSLNRASTYPLIARLPARHGIIAAVVLASLTITTLLAVLFVAAIILTAQVPLTPPDLAVISARWVAVLLVAVTFALHLSRFVARGGSNLIAYAILILCLISFQRADYPSFAALDWTENLVTRLLVPLNALIGGAAAGTGLIYAGYFTATVLYSSILYLAAIWLFRDKDLAWAE